MRMPIGIETDLFIEFSNLGFTNIDEYVQYLKGIIKKLQEANKTLQSTIDNLNNINKEAIKWQKK